MIELDSEIIRECGNDIKRLSNDYYQVMNKMFSRIEGMNTQTGEWTGLSASRFIANSVFDSQQYRNFSNSLKGYAQSLINTANKIDVLCREVMKK